MHVIGTAGHIDHGKSTLIRALTGIDPDRRKEEKERGMTIDLGFAYLKLPSGREVGVVDVPGHQRFIKNMLAGVGGVDLALFVVAATEGWMPQSQEHLEILDLLGISRGVIALTKADLVDEEWLDLVEEEVREKVRGTVLEGAPVVRVAVPTGQGLDELKAAIDAAIAGAPEPPDLGRPRLWIDRVFTIKGTGTVVTGTLQGGTVRLEDELEVIPTGDVVRVRGIQMHNRPVEEGAVGGRVALNVAGLENHLERGDALVRPGQIAPSTVMHVHLKAVPGLPRPLPRDSLLKVYIGSAERLARVRLLDVDVLVPGEEALAQLELDKACAAQWQDRFVVRDPSQQVTVGGGRVLAAPARKVRGLNHRYRREEYSEAHVVLAGEREPERLDLSLLRARIGASEEALIRILLKEQGWLAREDLERHVPATRSRIAQCVQEAVAAGEAVSLPSFLVQAGAWLRLKEKILDHLESYHRQYPLRAGLPRETLRSHLGVGWRFFDEMVDALAKEGLLATEGARIRLAGHRVALTPAQEAQVERLLALLNQHPYAPPGLDELAAQVGLDEELVSALVDQGRIVRVAKGIVLSREAFEDIRAQVIRYIREHGSIDVAAVRDLLGTSRKYAVPILEYLDQIEVTRRVGDSRVLGLKAHITP